MKYSPSLETIKAYAESGAYKILPVSCELLADLCTPIEALRRLKQVSTIAICWSRWQSGRSGGDTPFWGLIRSWTLPVPAGT